jgi:hypothetical protein
MERLRREVLAVDSTAVKEHSQRDFENKKGESDLEAIVARGKIGFLLGYKAHTACCISCELPLAFTVKPCNVNEKLCFKLLLEELRFQGVSFKTVVADAQCDSAKILNSLGRLRIRRNSGKHFYMLT